MDTRSPHIDSLPTEVLLHVFSYLRPLYLFQTVSKVCTYWEGLCGDPFLYKTLVFRGGEVSTDTAVNLLKVAPLLEALTLIDVREEQFYNNVFCMKLPHLKTLHLGSGAVAQLANSCFELENLQINDEIYTNPAYRPVSRELIIALCSRFQKTLRSLRVGGGVWSQEAFLALLKCDRLETLGIFRPNTISDDNVLTISLIPNLRRLELRIFNLLPGRLIQLFTSGSLTNLVSLDLCEFKITDEVAAAIGEHLKNLQMLTLQGIRLSILGNDLTRIGVEDVIKGCLRLLELDLKFLGAEDDVEEIFLLIPVYLPGLKKLKLFPYKPKIVFEKFKKYKTRKAVAQIKTRMPDLQLELITV